MLSVHAPQGSVVVLCVSVYIHVSVTKLSATYLVCESKVQSVLLGSLWRSKGICVNFSETLCSPVFSLHIDPKI